MLLAWSLTTMSFAQPSAFSLFASDSIVEIHLTLDMHALMKSKFDEKNFPASLRVMHSASDSTNYEVDVRCRGNIRKETCYFPSLRVKFDKADFTYNKLKWVNVCDNSTDDVFLFKEYIAYKMYNVVSDKSFRVQLITVRYEDTGAKEKTVETYAFVLQNADELAADHGGRVHEPTVLKEKLLNPDELAVFSFFQYMIGNTDWAFGNRHNVETYTDPVTNSVIPVAYDFDYSGFVNTNYSTPHPTMPITHVTTRHNKSVCLSVDACEKARILFLERKDQILECCNAFDLLEGKSRRRAIEYVEGFFKIIEDAKTTSRIFTKDCEPLR